MGKRRTTKLAAAVAFSVMIGWATSVNAGATIYFEPGPHGGERAITPWGDYIIDVRGGSVWIGTEAEYEHGYVAGIEASQGYREVRTDDGERTFVDAKLPTAMVGNNMLTSIDPAVMLSLPSGFAGRPKRPAGMEYFSVDWSQSDPGAVSFVVLDKDSGRSYRPYKCINQPPFHSCEAFVPTDALNSSTILLFVQSHQKPGAIGPSTLAQLSYLAIKEHVRSLKAGGITPNPDDSEDDSFRDLIRLHAINPNIPDSIDGLRSSR